MVDPRIYRGAWVLVFIALVVFGFSFRDGPGGEVAALPQGTGAPDAGAEAVGLAARFGAVSPGSGADSGMAGAVVRALGDAGGFAVTSSTDVVRTVAGTRAVQTVEAERPGLSQGTVVVVADRDAALEPLAATSATAELVSLARFFSGTTLSRSLVLISTAGRDGAAGATAVAHRLVGTGVDAVIALGDLAARSARAPVVQAWAGGDRLAPALLTATLTGALRTGTGLEGLRPSFVGQIGRLVFPYLTGPQAPFGAVGLPAVGVTLAGTAAPRRNEPALPARVASVGLSIDAAVSALDHGAPVGGPSADLAFGTKLIPIWAMRLLVLALIAPVACSLVDAAARARRRGHSVLSWAVWALAGAVPMVLGLAVLVLSGAAGLIHAPPGAVLAGAPLGLGGIAALLLTLLGIALGYRYGRPVGVSAATSIGWRSSPDTPPLEAAVVALNVVGCLLALVVWFVNPFTALLFVPALHLWLWLAAPGLSASRLWSGLLVAGGLLLPGVAAVATMGSLHLAPWTFVWDLVVSLAGGGVGVGAGLIAALAGGLLTSAVILVARAVGRGESVAPAPATVRGPMGYAGPGSLGGTRSALRR